MTTANVRQRTARRRATQRLAGLLGVAMVLPVLGAGGASGQTDAPGDDIVVVAKRRRCDLRIADRILSDREFRARAAEWAAGRPVRIHVPSDSTLRCQAKILFKLQRYGVHRAAFIDDDGAFRGASTD